MKQYFRRHSGPGPSLKVLHHRAPRKSDKSGFANRLLQGKLGAPIPHRLGPMLAPTQQPPSFQRLRVARTPAPGDMWRAGNLNYLEVVQTILGQPNLSQPFTNSRMPAEGCFRQARPGHAAPPPSWDVIAMCKLNFQPLGVGRSSLTSLMHKVSGPMRISRVLGIQSLCRTFYLILKSYFSQAVRSALGRSLQCC